MRKFLKNYKFPIILLTSIIIGSIIGIIFKEDASVLKPLGDLFLNMLYTIVVPLVFFTISSSVANMLNMKRLGKILRKTFLVFVITSFVASLLMLVVLLFIDPVGKENIILEVGDKIESVNIFDQLVSAVTVNDFKDIISRDHMLPLIIFSLVFGICVNLVEKEDKRISKGLEILSQAMMKIIKAIMYYAPIGLCAYFANLIGEFGPALLGSYAKTTVLYIIMSIIYFIVAYTIYTYIARGKNGVKQFYKFILPSLVTSLATQSSLATLPTNLESASDMNIKKDVREVVLPIGSTMHMEGSSMAAVLKIVFLFSVFNMPFTGISTYLLALLVAILSGVVMSGIPGGGLIGEMLIVSLYNFPPSAFPIIATIGWIVDPPATALNVVGDIPTAMLVEKGVGES
ncbi:MAG: dicarboxylate/amino acid:cation symporter [Bacilli bacterium]